MLYDNQGNLVLTRTTTPGGNTSTIDFGVTETVLTSSTTTTAKYYFVAGQRVAEQVGSTFSYLIPNLEGSPTVALSSTGYVSAVQLFLPYGASGFAWGTMPTAHNYTDQLLDSVMGLLYYGARWYDPLADQFVSADSVQGNPQWDESVWLRWWQPGDGDRSEWARASSPLISASLEGSPGDLSRNSSLFRDRSSDVD